MVDGHNFSLDTDTGSIEGIIIISEVDDYKYNWDYFGETN